MITYLERSAFDIFDSNAVLAHGVNCQGKMASGIAKEIRARYPKAYSEYREIFSVSKIIGQIGLLGAAQLVKVDSNNRYVANLFTQIFYGKDGGRYADQHAIYCSMKSLATILLSDDDLPKKIIMPKIGCGLGGLKWDKDVLPVINKILDEYPLTITVCSI